MLMTKRKPATIGEILVEEFMRPIGLTQGALAEAIGVQRKRVNELCNNRCNQTAAIALILARVFGNSADFWLNVQRRSDLREAMHSPSERKRIERARPLTKAAQFYNASRSGPTPTPPSETPPDTLPGPPRARTAFRLPARPARCSAGLRAGFEVPRRRPWCGRTCPRKRSARGGRR